MEIHSSKQMDITSIPTFPKESEQMPETCYFFVVGLMQICLLEMYS